MIDGLAGWTEVLGTGQEPKDAPASPESKEIAGEKVREGREEAERSGLQDHDGFICLFVFSDFYLFCFILFFFMVSARMSWPCFCFCLIELFTPWN